MLPAFKASYDVANYAPSVEYLNEGGLYSGVFRKAFLYEKMANDGGMNTFICFEFLTRKENKLATFNLFVAKNNNSSYINKNGENENYLGFRQLNAMMILLGVEEFNYSDKGSENVFNDKLEVTYLNELVNKPLILGFSTEEYTNKNGEIQNKIFLDRIFNIKMQSLEEFKENKEASSIHYFKPKHKALANNQTQKITPKEKQSYDPYSIEKKESKYIEVSEDDEELPF
ncbi:hypothetical protein [Campylobacter sp. CCS1377]|uniref:Single-stranded DNA-binding protein n=1 Tax=Campylobacter sp. CCS1377 TaxID=3158229 RepID=A0AAU7E3J2_9BACT